MPAQPRPNNQHVVTKNLLRNFANPGGFLMVQRKNTGRIRERHVNVEGFIPNFITEDAQEAEARWNEIETEMDRVYEHIQDRSLFEHPDEEEMIKHFIALHIVRSVRLHRQIPGLIQSSVSNTIHWLQSRTDVSQAVRDEVARVFERQYTEQVSGGPLLRQAMFELLTQIGDHFVANNDVQVGIATEGAFILGDNPVVTFDNDNRQIDAPITQTDVCFMPLAPNIVVALPSKRRNLREFKDINGTGVERINALTLSAAFDRTYLGPAPAA